jgi:selenocysteine-specific elongation factor
MSDPAPRTGSADPSSGPASAGHVIATAGHVDHGKSSLILRLTGMDPDRLAEEKRRGLTIDLGFAWMPLPSGREVGFVDVPGHERFIRNMLAGVGPVRLVLFVVASDEGWKPQSEEHLQIIDLLGVEGAVVALTKRDLVDDDTAARRRDEIRERLALTRLESAPVVACSAVTGDGLDELRSAVDAMVAAAPPPEATGRPRQFLDRVFTIRGSGTVVTGTLTGGPLTVGQEAEILPLGHRARIRGIQTHRRTLQTAHPVSRVAVNLVGTPREDLERGDVLALPGEWRSTTAFDAAVRPVRGLDHPLTARGAYKLYAGSAERDVRIRFFTETRTLPPDIDEAFARVTTIRPIVLDLLDRFVVREAGRRETVAGGLVLDPHPPRRWDAAHAAALQAGREAIDRRTHAQVLLRERGFVRAAEAYVLTGVHVDELAPDAAIRVGSWITSPQALEEAADRLTESLARVHREHPLRPGLETSEARTVLAAAGTALDDPALAEAVVDRLAADGRVARTGAIVRLPAHAASTAGREDADRLVQTVRAGEPSPPTVRDLAQAGFGRELVQAACADGRLIKVASDLVVTPQFLARAEEVVRSQAGPPGITVSGFRQALGTSRKYALPLLEYFDGLGLTRRQGDVRLLRN